MTEAHRNNENYLTHVLHQKNEAWNEGNRLNGRVAHLEQRLQIAEWQNDNLQVELHVMQGQLHPFHPPGAAEMEDGTVIIDDGMVVGEEGAKDEGPVMDVDESDDEGGHASGMDTDDEE